jgi:hypothetical protein
VDGTCGTHVGGERSEGKSPLGRPRRRWEDNIKLYFREIGLDEAN